MSTHPTLRDKVKSVSNLLPQPTPTLEEFLEDVQKKKQQQQFVLSQRTLVF